MKTKVLHEVFIPDVTNRDQVRLRMGNTNEGLPETSEKDDIRRNVMALLTKRSSQDPAQLLHEARVSSEAAGGPVSQRTEGWWWGLAAVATPACGFEAVLHDALTGQFRQDIVQIVGVGVAVARQVGHHLRLVVDTVPHHCVWLASGARRSHSENETPHPGHLQQLQHLFTKRR